MSAEIIQGQEPEKFEDLMAMIRKLSSPQQDALSRICCGDDSCLNPDTAKALAKRGLILYGLVSERAGFSLYRAEVASVRVHYAWCQWCSEQVEAPK